MTTKCSECERLTARLAEVERERDHKHAQFIEMCGESDRTWDALGPEALEKHDEPAAAINELKAQGDALREQLAQADAVIEYAVNLGGISFKSGDERMGWLNEARKRDAARKRAEGAT